MPLFAQQTRAELRQTYIDAWRKHRRGEALEPLQAQLVRLIAEHPEYHALLEAAEPALHADFAPEVGAENPFLHLGLHLAVREQVATDRPAGIAAAHRRLSLQLGSVHLAEHRMLEALGETLWEAQRDGCAPDEQTYLARVERLSGAGR